MQVSDLIKHNCRFSRFLSQKLNFRYQPENIRKNIGIIVSSIFNIEITRGTLIFIFFTCWYLQLGFFSQIVFVQKFQEVASVQNYIEIYIVLHFISVWNGCLECITRICWSNKYTWVFFFGKAWIIIKDKNYLGNSNCRGAELCFMGNEKQCYQ